MARQQLDFCGAFGALPQAAKIDQPHGYYWTKCNKAWPIQPHTLDVINIQMVCKPVALARQPFNKVNSLKDTVWLLFYFLNSTTGTSSPTEGIFWAISKNKPASGRHNWKKNMAVPADRKIVFLCPPFFNGWQCFDSPFTFSAGSFIFILLSSASQRPMLIPHWFSS